MFHLPSCETTNTDLAAALASVGIPLVKECPVRVMTGAVKGGSRYCFFFESQSPCGNYKTDELIKAWDDKEWHRQHPQHPFAYVKVAMQNRARLLDYVKSQVPIFVAEKNGKIAFLSLNASPATEQAVFQRLNKAR